MIPKAYTKITVAYSLRSSVMPWPGVDYLAAVRSAGERLTQYALSVASGELTTSELLDTRDSAISRFGISM